MPQSAKVANLVRETRNKLSSNSSIITCRNHRLFWHQYSPKHLPELVYYESQLKNSSDVLHRRVQRSIRERPRDGLWILWLVPNAVSPKKVIRSYIVKRLRAGWRRALEEEGLDQLGRSLDGRDERNLQGSLKVMTRNEVLGLVHDKEVVNKETAKMAKEIIEHCCRLKGKTEEHD